MCSWLLIFMAPTVHFLLLIGFFVAADTITGSVKALRIGDFVSKKFLNFVPKFIVFGVGILVAHMIQVQFFPDFPAMKLVAGLIAWGELISIDENIHAISGLSLFKFFINKLKR